MPRLTLTLPGHQTVAYARPVVMGVLNLTPDSFSDGARHNDPRTALQHAQQMILDGADIIDVGAESTRPGADRISADDQIARITPLIRDLARHIENAEADTIISIDTTRAPVAAAALGQGAQIINDVSAGRDDPDMFQLAAHRHAPIVLMHMQGSPADMQKDPTYTDVVTEVRDFLLERARAAIDAGVRGDQILIDPGVGFGKTLDHNLQLLANLDRFVATGYPVLLGASRKRFISDLAQRAHLPRPNTDQRLGGTCAATALAVTAGVAVIRVHDVPPNRQAADLADALAGY